ncbi:protein of unknown function [Taphrina deformans PYCC 5710]|uniref:Uncharacterized protein n=1 Tax=Taphrina deformans (strain PYCC 5710 / ATCC 11124 / CBS 356.35 / IMI 108563 / JCM 9778 / NBRC 8474) TaxID=1097556 RepID=R4XA46_TAPDE|nr:protein of unknown function [Taphrina deformans PYCC 5710]|eukprot:CCG82617.1 protein of unknown function [Taphrina deformans PYCC 5710]
MSLSISPTSSARFTFVRQGDKKSEPIQQLVLPQHSEKGYEADPTVLAASLSKFHVIFDESTRACNLELNKIKNPFVGSPGVLTPSDSTTSMSQVRVSAERPILYHSAGLWSNSGKAFCKKVDMRYLYYQHFLNIQKVSNYQQELLSSMLQKAKRKSRVEESITLSLFLHESSGLRTAIDSDVELFRKWHEGEFKGTLRRKFSSERMLFKGYVDELNDHWRHLTSEELFQLPIIRMLSRTPADILSSPTHREVKDINQRTYFNTLVHMGKKDRGHTLY